MLHQDLQKKHREPSIALNQVNPAHNFGALQCRSCRSVFQTAENTNQKTGKAVLLGKQM